MTDHETSARAAKPENGRSDLLWPAKAANRHVSHHFFHGFCFTGEHACDHWRFDDAWTDCVDADAPGCIFEARALCQSQHPVFRGVIDAPSGDTHESAKRRVVDDGAASLL